MGFERARFEPVTHGLQNNRLIHRALVKVEETGGKYKINKVLNLQSSFIKQ